MFYLPNWKKTKATESIFYKSYVYLLYYFTVFHNFKSSGILGDGGKGGGTVDSIERIMTDFFNNEIIIWNFHPVNKIFLGTFLCQKRTHF